MGNGASVASSGSGASEEGKDFNLTGNQTLDKQHRGLFEKIDALAEAFKEHGEEETRLAKEMGLEDTQKWKDHHTHHMEFKNFIETFRFGLQKHINTDDEMFHVSE
jgi:hypothetical protein